MSSLSLYAWDFNRLSPDFNLASLTCSVAIFQWQPKASGKGLKKVNFSRVCGYTAEVSRVYAKAREICDRLNAEQAEAGSPPAWLQKQYSIARPKGWVDPHATTDLPGSVVRSIRAAVMKRLLLPEGFVKGAGGTYVRRFEDQIHVIDFQASRYGHQYIVNLAFHYTFLRPLFARKTIELADYSQLDCGLRARIGQFTKSKLDKWFDYGTDRGRLQQTFEQNVRDCLSVFQTAAKRFSDPSRLLNNQSSLNARLIRPWHADEKEFVALLARHVFSKL